MDLPTEIFSNEINTSGYVKIEQASLNFIRAELHSHGYTCNKNESIWQKDQRRIYLRLVDSVDDVGDIDKLTRDDIIITDNFISKATAATVINLPTTWHGIYSHDVTLLDIPVERDYSFLINRIDVVRLKVMLELSKKIHQHLGWINFNCVLPKNWDGHNNETAKANRDEIWAEIGEEEQIHYRGEWTRLEPKLPFNNRSSVSFDQAMQSVKVNMVMETYSPNDIISFSEKTFRALVLPVPWTLYAGRYAIQRLRHLGFDTLDDLVDHDLYDSLYTYEYKHRAFVKAGVDAIDNIDMDRSRDRLLTAATHNQKILADWKSVRRTDFQNWLESLSSVL